jgi:hypothetical protein
LTKPSFYGIIDNKKTGLIMPQGVYILLTSDGARVAPSDDYDSLFDGYTSDMGKYIHRDNFVSCFGASAVMTETEAMVVAKNVAKAYNEMSDGIRVLTDYRFYSFEELKNGSASKG